MFSEYASRFLAQSQSRLLSSDIEGPERPSTFTQTEPSSSRAPSRGYLQRQPFGNPYQGSAPQSSRFPFASRFTTQPQQAPLFFSATDDFREDEAFHEHDHEVADFYALQRSRRDFARGQSTASDESDKEVTTPERTRRAFRPRRSRPNHTRLKRDVQSSRIVDEEGEHEEQESSPFENKSRDLPEDIVEEENAVEAHEVYASKVDDPLVNIELASMVAEGSRLLHLDNNEDEDTPRQHHEEDQPDQNRRQQSTLPRFGQAEDLMRSRFAERLPSLLRPRPPSPDVESVPAPTELPPSLDVPRHDTFWAALYQLSLAAMFASFILSLLHNPSAPTNGSLGDTIYTTLHSSFYLLAVDTLVATIVALLWLAMLRSFVGQLVILILVAVPILATSFSLYPFIASFKGSWHGYSAQDRAMRWLSLIPATFAIGWTYTAYKSRHALGRAIELLEFSTRVLAASPALILVGFGTLVAVVVWTWIWMLMFTRLFLGGHITTTIFSIDTGTWCLGVFFVLTYLWTLSIASGIQRATSAATVSQWYFHRLTNPSVRSSRVVTAALEHAFTTIFGTICLSTLLAIAIRLPLLVLPRRLSGLVTMCFYTLVPTSLATLTNPLTLTYAAIHSQPLTVSAQGLSELYFLPSSSPTTALTPGAAARSCSDNTDSNAANTSTGSTPLVAYRLAKFLLHATRFVTALAFAFGGWVATARQLEVQGAVPGVKGSLYAYVVGLIAGAIGWAVLGAMEGVLAGVLDAVVVCWGSEVGRGGVGDGLAVGRRYCREAGELLGGNLRVGGARVGGGGIGL